MTRSMSCPLCGARFDPDTEIACGSCPMHGACTLACCPECGYTTVDIGSSRSAGLLAKLFPTRKQETIVAATLDVAALGEDVAIAGFAEDMTTGHRELLRAYGIEPGRIVRVGQHSPVTVVRVDETEIALEADLARLIFIGAAR
jgi:Fe2+ transport system protein FeoA